MEYLIIITVSSIFLIIFSIRVCKIYKKQDKDYYPMLNNNNGNMV